MKYKTYTSRTDNPRCHLNSGITKPTLSRILTYSRHYNVCLPRHTILSQKTFPYALSGPFNKSFPVGFQPKSDSLWRRILFLSPLQWFNLIYGLIIHQKFSMSIVFWKFNTFFWFNFKVIKKKANNYKFAAYKPSLKGKVSRSDGWGEFCFMQIWNKTI